MYIYLLASASLCTPGCIQLISPPLSAYICIYIYLYRQETRQDSGDYEGKHDALKPIML
jgi:hypothetical protein